MTKSDIQTILRTTYPQDLTDSMLVSYDKALAEYKKGHWSYFGNEIGQFIEVARRIVEYQLEGKYTPLSEKLKIFNEKVLTEWENKSTAIPEVYRIIIPRALYAMYCLRNKRGMIHANHIDPNRMDATVLLWNTKWILAEYFRLASALPFEETKAVVDSIMCRETSIIWDNGSMLRVLDTKMPTRDKILCLLYIKNNQSEIELRNSTEYKNVSEFKKILKTLHSGRLIEYSDGNCTISPTGIDRAEMLLTK